MKIHIKPRIHVTLISMHNGGYRMNGGIGFSINEPKGILTFESSDSFSFTDKRSSTLTSQELKQLEAVLYETQISLDFKKSLKITLEGGILTHYGMGSGTAIRLACLEALFLLNNRPANQNALINYSKRGGTSGIGINTYFFGKFIFDLGVESHALGFMPSSKADATNSPLLLDSIYMPDWKIGLCIPKLLKTKTQEEESQFFKNTCPVASAESYKTLYHSLFGTYASIRDKDMVSFSKSIKAIQECEWKRQERIEHGDQLLKIEKRLYDLGALCVGLSSLGPLMFFTAEDNQYEDIMSGMKDQNCDLVITTGSNSGRELVS